MTKVNRITLKNYFKAGEVPTEQSFVDLIDSAHNIIDDGSFDNSLLVSKDQEGHLIEFCTNEGDKQATWKFEHIESDGLYLTSSEAIEERLTLKTAKEIVLHADSIRLEGYTEKGITRQLTRDGHNFAIDENVSDGEVFELYARYQLNKKTYWQYDHFIVVNGDIRFITRKKYNKWFRGRVIKLSLKIKDAGDNSVYLLSGSSKYSLDDSTIKYTINRLLK